MDKLEEDLFFVADYPSILRMCANKAKRLANKAELNSEYLSNKLLKLKEYQESMTSKYIYIYNSLKKFTDEELSFILKYYFTDYKAIDLAKEMGISQRTIFRLIARLKYKYKTFTN